jgi:hypothetical protein
LVNRAKNKGTAAETAVVEFLKANGFPQAERRTLSGSNDKGDINVSPDVVIEVKNVKTMTLSVWMDEAIAESENAGAWVTAVWHKRIRKGDPANWYVTMDGAMFAGILIQLRRMGAIR